MEDGGERGGIGVRMQVVDSTTTPNQAIESSHTEESNIIVLRIGRETRTIRQTSESGDSGEDAVGLANSFRQHH